jgi:hypothetical protein
VEGTQRTAGGGSGGSDQLRDTLSRPGVFGRGTFSNTFHGRRESGCLKRFITVCTTTTPERAGKFTCIHADLYTHLYTRRGPSESSDSEILSDSEGPLRVYKRVYSEEVGLSVYTSLRVYKCVYSEDPLVLNGTRALSKSSDQQDKQNCSVDKFCLWFRVGLLRTSC